MLQVEKPYWSFKEDELFQILNSSRKGLTSQQVNELQSEFQVNQLKAHRHNNTFEIFLSQFKSPILILLFVTAVLSFFSSDAIDGSIILIILLISSFLGFLQEKQASNAVEKLLKILQTKISVLRDEILADINIENIVPGDVVELTPGKSIPADGIVFENKNIFIDESVLTGESFSVEKTVDPTPINSPLSKRTNMVFMGTHVISGIARIVVVRTGKTTEFGKISERLKLRPSESEFEHGIRIFGNRLLELTLFFLIIIFFVGTVVNADIFNTFIFAMSLAVGLTPQLLPTIIEINLARGAKRMAEAKVIVKKLNCIENLGSMNIFCSDKTGTLTEGKVKVHSIIDWQGMVSKKGELYAYLNAFFQEGYKNPIDEAIRTNSNPSIVQYAKKDEIPYDFIRKRLTISLHDRTQVDLSGLLITKGAVVNISQCCTKVESASSDIIDIKDSLAKINEEFQSLSNNGYKLLGLAYRNIDSTKVHDISPADETDMIFLGFIQLFDPLKPGIQDVIQRMNHLGIKLKIITGDNQYIATNIGHQLIPEHKLLTGTQLNQLADSVLVRTVENIDIFAEIEPNQKERIILALKKAGNVVGYIGDGINDATALHAADIGISVDSAVDVAKDAADIVLLEHDLKVLIGGIEEGRKTFANTMKYVFITTSANFGNMFSMAGASLFLPFLPLTPVQVLLTNVITDVPAISLAGDNVDPDWIKKPRRWNVKFIEQFMLIFGLISSIFDYAIFFIMLWGLKVDQDQFRSLWFLESCLTELVIMFIIRTESKFYKSKPSTSLIISASIVILFIFVLVLTPLGTIFTFVAFPLIYLLIILGLILLYIVTTMIAKKLFYAHYQF